MNHRLYNNFKTSDFRLYHSNLSCTSHFLRIFIKHNNLKLNGYILTYQNHWHMNTTAINLKKRAILVFTDRIGLYLDLQSSTSHFQVLKGLQVHSRVLDGTSTINASTFDTTGPSYSDL